MLQNNSILVVRVPKRPSSLEIYSFTIMVSNSHNYAVFAILRVDPGCNLKCMLSSWRPVRANFHVLQITSYIWISNNVLNKSSLVNIKRLNPCQPI